MIKKKIEPHEALLAIRFAFSRDSERLSVETIMSPFAFNSLVGLSSFCSCSALSAIFLTLPIFLLLIILDLNKSHRETAGAVS